MAALPCPLPTHASSCDVPHLGKPQPGLSLGPGISCLAARRGGVPSQEQGAWALLSGNAIQMDVQLCFGLHCKGGTPQAMSSCRLQQAGGSQARQHDRRPDPGRSCSPRHTGKCCWEPVRWEPGQGLGGQLSGSTSEASLAGPPPPPNRQLPS